MKETKKACNSGCPVEAALNVIGGKWKGLILHHLNGETRRFNELKRKIPGITQRMLTKQLRELEQGQIVHRKVFAQVPPKVEYSLSEFGQTLKPVIHQLQVWGQAYLERTSDFQDKN